VKTRKLLRNSTGRGELLYSPFILEFRTLVVPRTRISGASALEILKSRNAMSREDNALEEKAGDRHFDNSGFGFLEVLRIENWVLCFRKPGEGCGHGEGGHMDQRLARG
jgi:hypothetical protein